MFEQLYTHGRYLEKHPTWHVEDSAWKATQILRIIERNNIRPNTICEVGCGAGEILNQLSRRITGDVQFTGYEISPQAFELCKERVHERLQFRLKDVFQDEDATFDLVLAIDIIEHIEDFFGFLRKLRVKGKLKIFHFPLDLSVLSVLRGKPLMRKRHDLGHIHYFTKELVLATLCDAGYEIIDHSYTAYSTELDPPSLGTFARKLLFAASMDMGVRLMGGCSLIVLAQ